MRFARPVGCNALILNLTTVSSVFKNPKVKILEGARGGRKTSFHLMYGKMYI
jgi:hypothetical protein